MEKIHSVQILPMQEVLMQDAFLLVSELKVHFIWHEDNKTNLLAGIYKMWSLMGYLSLGKWIHVQLTMNNTMNNVVSIIQDKSI